MAIEIVDFPIKNGGSFHSKMLVHQRVLYACGNDNDIRWQIRCVYIYIYIYIWHVWICYFWHTYACGYTAENLDPPNFHHFHVQRPRRVAQIFMYVGHVGTDAMAIWKTMCRSWAPKNFKRWDLRISQRQHLITSGMSRWRVPKMFPV